jgi:hypothetical protein
VQVEHRQSGEQNLQFAKANQGISAHNREMQGTILLNQLQNALDQLVAFFVGKLAKVNAISNMVVLVGVATRATQRTLARYLNRKRGSPSA